MISGLAILTISYNTRMSSLQKTHRMSRSKTIVTGWPEAVPDYKFHFYNSSPELMSGATVKNG